MRVSCTNSRPLLVFGKKLNFATTYCRLNNKKIQKVEQPYINLYIKVTDWCNASCPFCEYRGLGRAFNIYKLFESIKEINKTIRINKVSFTGGEPTTSGNLLLYLIKEIRELIPEAFITVNTNGYRLHHLLSADVNSIALSRHHYDDKRNDNIFKINALSAEALRSIDPSKIHLSCNLIKGEIDSANEVEKYLSFASSCNIHDVGFVGLMPVNDYCKTNYVDFNKLSFDKKHIIKYKTYRRTTVCKCSNYLYIKAGAMTLFYNRCVLKPDDTVGSLVFDGQHLRSGFNQTIIYQGEKHERRNETAIRRSWV